MKIFALSDFHLSFASPVKAGQWDNVELTKPMEVFGPGWHNFYQRLYDNWLDTVGPEDAVLVAGDISWGMNLEECRHDFAFLGQLPGVIILGRGNHDYWWQGIGKLKKALPSNIIPVHHDCAVVGGKAVCSTRGWSLPGSNDYNDKIYQRELLRLEMALQAGEKTGLPLVAMLHFMPINNADEDSDFCRLLRDHQVELCIFGHLHLHGDDCKRAVNGNYWGIEFINTSLDCLDCRPKLLWETV
ncbi:MAG: metallophosphoesterase [Clostridiales bacterium]|nr:metallophosphoesterase [Clostridiales bacterium]